MRFWLSGATFIIRVSIIATVTTKFLNIIFISQKLFFSPPFVHLKQKKKTHSDNKITLFSKIITVSPSNPYIIFEINQKI